MADATVLKTVGLIIRTGSSPVSGTHWKAKTRRSLGGFCCFDSQLDSQSIIRPFFPPLRHLDLLGRLSLVRYPQSLTMKSAYSFTTAPSGQARSALVCSAAFSRSYAVGTGGNRENRGRGQGKGDIPMVERPSPVSDLFKALRGLTSSRQILCFLRFLLFQLHRLG